jgi:hypothetical protein
MVIRMLIAVTTGTETPFTSLQALQLLLDPDYRTLSVGVRQLRAATSRGKVACRCAVDAMLILQAAKWCKTLLGPRLKSYGHT